MKIKNKKRTIEIYFILYLAALLFLLPDGSYESKKGKGSGIQIYQPEFVIIPEKTTLTCRVVLDSAGPKIISLDSVNTIFYTGDVEDVQFEFKVEDQYLQNTLTLSSAKNSITKYFRFDDQPEKHAAFFRWSPPLQENFSRTYIVKVNATAKLRDTENQSNDQKGKLLKHTSQFNLLVIYLNAPGGNPLFAQNYNKPFFLDTSYQFTLPFQSIIQQMPSGDVMGLTQYPEVRQMANRRWTNSITFTNINLKNELLRFELLPKSKLDNGGTAEIVEIRQNDIILQGITPSYGKMSVSLEVFRKKDNNSGRISFNVSPTPFEQPDFEKNMYPEITYKIDPKLPDIGKDVKAIITDGNTVRAQSKGETFRWSPQPFDVNKEFYLDRYIENQLLERTPIHILPYSIPMIIELKNISSNEVEVITKAFGIYNKSRNEVDYFNVEGNAKYRDLRGQITEQQEKFYPVVVQYFRIFPSDPSKPFSFKIEAVDRIGNKSMPKIYR